MRKCARAPWFRGSHAPRGKKRELRTRFPNLYGLVPTPRSQRLTVGGKRKAQYLAVVAQLGPRLPGCHVPGSDFARPVPIAVAAGQNFAVGTKRDSPDIPSMAFQHSLLPTCAYIPNANDPIARAGRHTLAGG